MQIVSISGLKGSGKSSLAQLLVDQGFTRVSFAGRLKDLAVYLYRWDRDALDTLEYKEAVITPVVWDVLTALQAEAFLSIPHQSLSTKTRVFASRREALQIIGTEILRDYDVDFHVNELERSLVPAGRYVMDDSRFPNELDALDRWGASRCFVDRPGLAAQNHSSENSIGQEDFEHVIRNDGTLKQFLANGRVWFEQIGVV